MENEAGGIGHRVVTVLRSIVVAEILGSKTDQGDVQFLQMTQFGMQGPVKGSLWSLYCPGARSFFDGSRPASIKNVNRPLTY
jgi:hypothetical protein